MKAHRPSSPPKPWASVHAGWTFRVVWVAAVVLLATFAQSQEERPVTGEGERKGEVLFKLAADAPKGMLEVFRPDLNLRSRSLVTAVDGGGIYFGWSETATTEQLLEALTRHPSVVYAEPNLTYRADEAPDDTYFRQQWALRNTGQKITPGGKAWQGKPGADVNVVTAWDVTHGDDTGRKVVVGILDSGIVPDHPDLEKNVWRNTYDIGGCKTGYGYNALEDTTWRPGFRSRARWRW